MFQGECSEGSVWESFAFASFYKLDNLCAIIDVNRLGQSDPTPLQHDTETYRKRVDAFGYARIVYVCILSINKRGSRDRNLRRKKEIVIKTSFTIKSFHLFKLACNRY